MRTKMLWLPTDLRYHRLLPSPSVSYLELLLPLSLCPLALHGALDAGRTRLAPELVTPVLDVLVRGLVAYGLPRNTLELVECCSIDP